MAVSPIRYLVAPRVHGLHAHAAHAYGGCRRFRDYGWRIFRFGKRRRLQHLFFSSAYKYSKVHDLTNGLIKSLVFGYLIGIIACMQGLRTEGGATGVGRSTTRSVVMCVVVITIADFFLAVILQQQSGRR